MKYYIVGYFTSWGLDRNCKIIGIFNSFKNSSIEAKKFVQELRTVYIVESELNNTITPISDETEWLKDYNKYYIVHEEYIQKFITHQTD